MTMDFLDNNALWISLAQVFWAYLVALAQVFIAGQKVRALSDDVFWRFTYTYNWYALTGIVIVLCIALLGDLRWTVVFLYVFSYIGVIHLVWWVVYFHHCLTGEPCTILYGLEEGTPPWTFRYGAPRILPNYYLLLNGPAVLRAFRK